MGTSVFLPLSNCLWEDHPHAYGDKGTKISEMTADQGSSPRVWGQAAMEHNLISGLRIIPTRMGTSVLLRFPLALPQDHPHAYGDKQVQNYEKNGEKGSSPRVWGQVQSDNSVNFSLRIIPTRMGTRSPVVKVFGTK